MPQAEARCQTKPCDWFAIAADQTIIPRTESHVSEKNHIVLLKLWPGAKGFTIRLVERTENLGRLGLRTVKEVGRFDEKGEPVEAALVPAPEAPAAPEVAERLKCSDCDYKTPEGRDARAKDDLANHRRIAHAPRISLKCPEPKCEVWILRMNEVKARQKLRRHLADVHGFPWEEAERRAMALEPREAESVARALEKGRARGSIEEDEDDYLEELIEYNVSLLATPPTKCSACGGLLDAKGEAVPATLIDDILYVTCCVGCYGYILDFLEAMGVEVR